MIINIIQKISLMYAEKFKSCACCSVFLLRFYNDFISRPDVVGVQLLGGELHLLGALVVSQVLVHVEQSHLVGRDAGQPLQLLFQIHY